MDALVLAGGRLERDRFPDAAAAVECKALLPLLDRSLLSWVLEALGNSPGVRRVAVVGPPALAAVTLASGATPVQETATIAGNLRSGLESLLGLAPPPARILALSGDLPLLTPAAIADLLTRAPVAEAVFPCVQRRVVDETFPGRGWIFARTRDGELTGSSAALISPLPVLERWPWVERLLEARRLAPWRLALLFGAGLALRYASGQLRIVDVERRAEQLLGLTARAYVTPYPELALDVDKQADLEVCAAVLRARAAGCAGSRKP